MFSFVRSILSKTNCFIISRLWFWLSISWAYICAETELAADRRGRLASHSLSSLMEDSPDDRRRRGIQWYMSQAAAASGLSRNERVISGAEDVDIEAEIWDARASSKTSRGTENDWPTRGRWLKSMCPAVRAKLCLGSENKGAHLLDSFISMIWGSSE